MGLADRIDLACIGLNATLGGQVAGMEQWLMKPVGCQRQLLQMTLEFSQLGIIILPSFRESESSSTEPTRINIPLYIQAKHNLFIIYI